MNPRRDADIAEFEDDEDHGDTDELPSDSLPKIVLRLDRLPPAFENAFSKGRARQLISWRLFSTHFTIIEVSKNGGSYQIPDFKT